MLTWPKPPVTGSLTSEAMGLSVSRVIKEPADPRTESGVLAFDISCSHNRSSPAERMAFAASSLLAMSINTARARL